MPHHMEDVVQKIIDEWDTEALDDWIKEEDLNLLTRKDKDNDSETNNLYDY